MPIYAIIIGILLDIVGIAGWLLTGTKSLTALIPAALGMVLVVTGVLSIAKPGWRKHLMHLAMLVALLGVLGGGRMLLKGLQSQAPAADPQVHSVRVTANGVTAAACLVFLVQGVRSFVAARKKNPQETE